MIKRISIMALATILLITGCQQKQIVQPQISIKAQGAGYMPVQTPLKTCLFFPFGDNLNRLPATDVLAAPRTAAGMIKYLRSPALKGSGIRDSWSYFADTSSDEYRSACMSSIARGGGNCIVVLLSNGASSAPVSFFKDSWGGTPDMDKLALLVQQAKAIHDAGGAIIPCFFCDESDSAAIRNADMQTHARAFGLLITLLRPYCPAFMIGLESSEYFTTARHNEFYDLIKYLAPDRYVLVHMQGIPKDGMPKCDAWAYEASWNPWDGDNHAPAELVSECKVAQNKSGKPIWPLEYNVLIGGNVIITQSKAVLDAGFLGCGGPIK